MRTDHTNIKCKVTYKDGKAEVFTGLATVNNVSLIEFIENNLANVNKVEVLEILPFKSEQDYLNYFSTQKNQAQS
jgi:hypothetical protein